MRKRAAGATSKGEARGTRRRSRARALLHDGSPILRAFRGVGRSQRARTGEHCSRTSEYTVHCSAWQRLTEASADDDSLAGSRSGRRVGCRNDLASLAAIPRTGAFDKHSAHRHRGHPRAAGQERRQRRVSGESSRWWRCERVSQVVHELWVPREGLQVRRPSLVSPRSRGGL